MVIQRMFREQMHQYCIRAAKLRGSTIGNAQALIVCDLLAVLLR